MLMMGITQVSPFHFHDVFVRRQSRGPGSNVAAILATTVLVLLLPNVCQCCQWSLSLWIGPPLLSDCRDNHKEDDAKHFIQPLKKKSILRWKKRKYEVGFLMFDYEFYDGRVLTGNRLHARSRCEQKKLLKPCYYKGIQFLREALSNRVQGQVHREQRDVSDFLRVKECKNIWFLSMKHSFREKIRFKSGRLLLLSKWFSTQNGINAYSQTRYQGGLREPYHFGFTAIMCPGRRFEDFWAKKSNIWPILKILFLSPESQTDPTSTWYGHHLAWKWVRKFFFFSVRKLFTNKPDFAGFSDFMPKSSLPPREKNFFFQFPGPYVIGMQYQSTPICGYFSFSFNFKFSLFFTKYQVFPKYC